jgi:hypothetical protein
VNHAINYITIHRPIHHHLTERQLKKIARDQDPTASIVVLNDSSPRGIEVSVRSSNPKWAETLEGFITRSIAEWSPLHD